MRNGWMLCRFILVLLLAAAAQVSAAPFQVSSDSRFRNENWFPLTPTEMKEASVDTALARLTDSGLFQFIDGAGEGSLVLDVSLVERAETAKITLTLDLPVGSYVSTASTSLHGLEWQGIFRAFEHIGTQSAGRMLVKLAALNVAQLALTDASQETAVRRLERVSAALEERLATLPSPSPTPSQWERVFSHGRDLLQQHKTADARATFNLILSLAPTDDPWSLRARDALSGLDGAAQAAQPRAQAGDLKALYEEGQALKRAANFFEARIAFERLVQGAEHATQWRTLAVEELIYGLPLFEARYWTLQVGGVLANREPQRVRELQQRAENLYRQIVAENDGHPQRIIEAQGAIDQLRISQQAVAMMLRQNVLAQLGPFRLELVMYYQDRGHFPEVRDAEAIFGTAYRLVDYQGGGDKVSGKIHSADGHSFRISSALERHGVRVNFDPIP